ERRLVRRERLVLAGLHVPHVPMCLALGNELLHEELRVVGAEVTGRVRSLDLPDPLGPTADGVKRRETGTGGDFYGFVTANAEVLDLRGGLQIEQVDVHVLFVAGVAVERDPFAVA